MEKPENRQIHLKKTFNIPISLMWEIWTTPDHIANWWGPKGFSSTIHEMDVKPGGDWKLTLQGPSGQNFANRSIFKEIVPYQKIVFEHFNPHFITIVLFEAKGDKTIVDWTLLFDTVEMYEIVVNVHKADKGQQENIEKLEDYLAKLVN